MAMLPEQTAERHLAHQITIQVDTMRKRGVDEELIERERRALEVAIRATLWRMVLSPGGAV
jgi:hypothetical protein